MYTTKKSGNSEQQKAQATKSMESQPITKLPFGHRNGRVPYPQY